MRRPSVHRRARPRRDGRFAQRLARCLGAELLEDRRMLYALTTGSGDGSLLVTVDGYGSFGSATGFSNNTGAIYDPIGPIEAASTTFQSGVAIRVGSAGTRQFLTSGSILGSGGLADPVTTGTDTAANSSFTIGGLNFALLQTVSPLLDNMGTQTGSILSQRYTITNPGTSSSQFELVRYVDGDLLFDGSLVDGGGRLVTAGREFLFETDAGGTGSTDTTFLGIDGVGGTIPTTNRFEVDSFAGLGQRIIDGTALDGIITGDSDGDGFIDSGSEYDVTLGLRNTFSLPGGESVTYTTRTVFGSGTPDDLPVDPLIEFGGDVMQLEGDSGLTPFAFTVNLTQQTNSTFVVEYTTVDGTATAGVDYVAQSGTLTFTAGGASSQTILVEVIGEELVEDNETFSVRLSSSTGGVLGDTEAIGTILNDDVVLSVGDISLLEGDSGTRDAVFTISAMGAVNETVRVSYTTVDNTAVAGSDYVARSGMATLHPGATSARVTVPVIGDRFNEEDETFFLVLNGPEGARLDRSQATATILNEDPLPNLYVSDVQVTRTDAGTAEAVFAVALDAPSGRNVVVEYFTSDSAAISGVDYTGQSGSLTFAPGVITRLVSVPVFTDGNYSSDRTFFLNLQNPLHAKPADPRGTATIVYADDPMELIVDNGDPDYSDRGGWTNVTNTQAYQLDYSYHGAGNGSAVATWSFPDIPNGSYQVFARWSAFVNRATNAPYTIFDGATPRGTVQVNQQLAPQGDYSNGISWQELGTFQVSSGSLVVQLGNNANGFVTADAVRIVAGGIAPQKPEMNVAGSDRSIDLGDDSPSFEDGTDFGQVHMLTDSVIHTFDIMNKGNADLHLTGAPRVTVSGPAAADFWMISQPTDTVAPTRKTNFQLIFHPTQPGVRTAVVSIANDDDSEHPYTFTVQGTGMSALPQFAHNDAMPQDVNNDARVSPLDALIVVNQILAQGAQAASATPLVAESSTMYVDVNGDGRLSGIDVLAVINYLLVRQSTVKKPAPRPDSADSASALVAVAVDRAITADDAVETSPLDLPAQSTPPDDTTSKAQSSNGMLLEPAGVEVVLSSEGEQGADHEDVFDPLLALGD